MKNKKIKRILSLFMALIMIVLLIPNVSITSNAVDASGINKRISQIVSELQNKFPNGYFTANGQAGHGETEYGNCSLYGIVNSKYPELSSTISSKSSNGWDCAAFAKLMTVLLFGTCKDTYDHYIGSGSSASTYDQLRPGDLFYSEHPHWMIYISHDSTGVTVLDANGYGDQKIGYYRKYSYSNGNLSGNLMTWQSPHWDDVNNQYSVGGSGTGSVSFYDVKVTDVTSSGYTVECYIQKHNGATISRVQFPTWTSKNGQDDLVSDYTTSSKVRGTYTGRLVGSGYSADVYEFKVKSYEHNYETGTYNTHIYVWISGSSEAQICYKLTVNVHDHSYYWVTDKSATCTSSGQKHKHCSICGENTNYTTISALGHDYYWVTDYSPTCTASGQKHQHCSRCGNNANYTSISALGHSWGTPTYTWSSDYSKCTAARVCSRDSSHKETETANVTSKVTREATETSMGEITYTATFSNSAFATQTKKVSTPKLAEWKGFPDVHKGDWFYDAVKYCATRGYVTGYSNGKFGPADTLKRQDFVLILARVSGADLTKYKNMSSSMPDVKTDSYYAAAVCWAVDKGIINGYDNGNFGVGDSITREQVATILYRYKKSPAMTNLDNTLKPFTDKDKVSSFAKAGIVWAIRKGIITGKTSTILAPTATASRAEIATIVMRMDQQGMFSA